MEDVQAGARDIPIPVCAVGRAWLVTESLAVVVSASAGRRQAVRWNAGCVCQVTTGILPVPSCHISCRPIRVRRVPPWLRNLATTPSRSLEPEEYALMILIVGL